MHHLPSKDERAESPLVPAPGLEVLHKLDPLAGISGVQPVAPRARRLKEQVVPQCGHNSSD